MFCGSENADRILDSHSRYYLDLVAGLESAFRGAGALEARRAFDEELPNIRAAWERALATKEYQSMGSALNSLYYCINELSGRLEAIRIAENSLSDLESDERARYLVLRIKTRLHIAVRATRGYTSEAVQHIEETLEEAENRGDDAEIAICLHILANAYFQLAPKRTIPILERAVEHCERVGDDYNRARMLLFLGSPSLAGSGIDRVVDFNKKALEVGRSIGAEHIIVTALGNMSILRILQGIPFEETAPLILESAERARRIDSVERIVWADARLCWLYCHRGDATKAVCTADENLRRAIESADRELINVAAMSAAGSYFLLHNWSEGMEFLTKCDVSNAGPADVIASLVVVLRAYGSARPGLLADTRRYLSQAVSSPVGFAEKQSIVRIAGHLFLQENDGEAAAKLISCVNESSATPSSIMPLEAASKAEVAEILGEERFDRAWRSGSRLSLDEAYSIVIERLNDDS